MASFRVLDRPRAECPDGSMSIDDFPPKDYTPVVLAIFKKAGISETVDVTESVLATDPRPEDSFRDVASEGASP